MDELSVILEIEGAGSMGGIGSGSPYRHVDVARAEIIAVYQTNPSATQIAKRYGVCKNAILHRLRAWGIAVRSIRPAGTGTVGKDGRGENRGRPLLLQFHISISLYPLAKANLSPRLTD
jgi:hypothetical protein